MRIRFIGAMTALLAGMGTALAQSPSPTSAPAVRLPSAQPDAGVKGPTPGEEPTMMPRVGDESKTAGDGYVAEGIIPSSACGAHGCECSPYYASVDYLLYKLKSAPTPPSFMEVPVASSGLNNFTSTVSVGGAGFDYGGRSGARITAGYWFDPEVCGGEFTGFWLERRANTLISTQQVNQTLTVTVIQNFSVSTASSGGVITSNQQVPINVALPSTLTVSAIGTAVPSDFWGTEATARSTRCHFGGVSFDVLGGFRYLNLSEGLLLGQLTTLQIANPNTIFTSTQITSNTQLAGLIPPPITGLSPILAITALNSMMTHNNYFGSQVGVSWDWGITEKLHFEGFGKIGVGAMLESFTITSGTQVNTAAVTGFSAGGIVPGVNFFNYGQTRYCVVPEMNLRFGYQICQHLRATVGFNFLYLSTVMRPGDQIAFNPVNVNGAAAANAGGAAGGAGAGGAGAGGTGGSSSSSSSSGASTAINIAGSNISVPSNQQPSILPKDTDFWAQGLTFGLEVKY